jgi:S-DNA-T family DNA segregation ATPase FtsK/SpoIIIE
MFGVGYGRTGKVWVDLTELPHLLLGGTTGSGKSVFLRQVLVRLVLDHGPEELVLVLIDLKGGMEFQLFRGLPHLMGPVVSDMPQFWPAMDAVVAELERRMAIFSEAGVVSLRDWNERHPADRKPYILVAIDEYGELSLPGAESSTGEARAQRPAKAAHAAVSRIARLGRACGIHLIACTQRPDNDVMPGQIKAQLPATVALKTRGEVNSHILLGDRNDGAARLAPYKGRAVFQWETEEEVQVPLLEPWDAAALLAAKYGDLVGHARVTQCPTRSEEIDEVAA